MVEVLETCELEREIFVDGGVVYSLFFYGHGFAFVLAFHHRAVIPSRDETLLDQFIVINEEVIQLKCFESRRDNHLVNALLSGTAIFIHRRDGLRSVAEKTRKYFQNN